MQNYLFRVPSLLNKGAFDMTQCKEYVAKVFTFFRSRPMFWSAAPGEVCDTCGNAMACSFAFL